MDKEKLQERKEYEARQVLVYFLVTLVYGYIYWYHIKLGWLGHWTPGLILAIIFDVVSVLGNVKYTHDHLMKYKEYYNQMKGLE